jgi:hypothetical protein
MANSRGALVTKGSISSAAAIILLVTATCGEKRESAGETPVGEALSTRTPFDPARGTATISGIVSFEGTVPPPATIKMGADPVCATLHKEPVTAQTILSRDGKLQNAFVYVKQGLEKFSFTPPAEPALLDQSGCQYIPRVGGVMVNQKLRIVNSDPTLHNVHCYAEHNRQFNIGQAIQGMETVKSFARPEVMMQFKCDVHKWMSSYIGVLPHPYFAVTGGEGAFKLSPLPPGDYVIEAWHERLGTQTQTVTVGDREAKEITFSFKAS